VLVATLLCACQPAAPVAETKPRRKSFEEASTYRVPAQPAAADNTQQQASQTKQTWDQARQATDDAERQRLAGEALKQTRSMAEEPAATPPTP
jgi:hypothetical protein